MPMLGNQDYPTQTELAPSRYAEQQVVEEFLVVLLAEVLGVFMLYTLLIAFRWHLNLRKTKAAPLLPTLPWRTQARILCWSVLPPLVIYLSYTRFSGMAGRELNINHSPWRIYLELGVLSLLVLILPGYLARRALRRQYLQLGVPTPPAGLEWLVRFIGGLGALLWVVLFTYLAAIPPFWWFRSLLENAHELEHEMPHELLFVFPLLLLVLAGLMFLPMLWERKWRRYGSYFGTLARTVAPMQAVIILLLTMVIYPAGMANERTLLHHDRIAYYQGHSCGPGPMPLEERVVQRMRREMLAAMK